MADLETYVEQMTDLRNRINRVNWEDIDPDADPTVPVKPTWHCTEHTTVYEELVLALEMTLEGALEESRVAPVRPAERYELSNNYDRLLELSERIAITEDGFGEVCWISSGSVRLASDTRTGVQCSPAVGMWVLEYGSYSTKDGMKKSCRTPFCIRPDHHYLVTKGDT